MPSAIFPTLESATGTRPSLLKLIAEVVSKDNPAYPVDSVTSETLVTTAQLAKIHIALKRDGILDEHKEIAGSTVGAIIGNIIGEA
jgi:hypothetical protein